MTKGFLRSAIEPMTPAAFMSEAAGRTGAPSRHDPGGLFLREAPRFRLLTSRAAFAAVGGFDMVNLPVAYADVDYCLKLRRAGLRVLWTPHARLYHLETQTRGIDDTPENSPRLAEEARRLRARWGDQLLDDPYYNPHFEPLGPGYGLLRPPPLD